MNETVITETRTTYRAPGTTRRYLSRHSAFVAWAKHLIFSRCECRRPVDINDVFETCAMHERLFSREAWVCPLCGAERESLVSCCGGASATEETTVHDSQRYMLVRDRLVRWLKWRDRFVREQEVETRS